MRCFLAFNFSEKSKILIHQNIHLLKPDFPKYSIKWVNKDHYHLTCIFFGEKSLAEINALNKEIFKNVLFQKLSITVNKISSFPQVVFYKIPDNSNIKKIYNSLKYLNPETRDYKPHITVGRIKNNYLKKNDILKINQLKIKQFEIEILSLSMVQSHLTPQGPDYKILQSF